MSQAATRVGRFEDLVAWQKARALTKAVYVLTARASFASDCDLVRQMRRAAVSTMSNLAEGFERGRRAEFHQFVSIGKGSCAELRSHLYVAMDAGYLDDPEAAPALAQAEELARILGGLRAALERQRDAI
jgi:four helix bundle protein